MGQFIFEYWKVFVSRGIVAVIFGLLVLLWPALTLTWFIGIYGVIYGALLIHLGMGSQKKEEIKPASSP